MEPTYFFGFDFGLASRGDAVRKKDKNGISFPVKESWLMPAELGQRGPATKSGTPASKYRASKVREARKAREQWLDQIWTAARLEIPKKRKVEYVDYKTKPGFKWVKGKKRATTIQYGGKWKVQKADEWLEREFAKKGDSTCYTSCLLRIKLLNGREKLEPWQIYKALYSAIQKRGYGQVPWAAKEAARGNENPKMEEEKDLESERNWKRFERGFKAWEDEASDSKRQPIPEKFHLPCYYDAFQMRLWGPDEISLQHDHTASSTRGVRFPRKAVCNEIIQLGNLAASDEQLAELKAVFKRIQNEGWLATDEVSWFDPANKQTKRGKRVRRLKVLAKTFGEFLCYGPGGKEYAAYTPETINALEMEVLEHPDLSQKGKKNQLRPGTDLDWLGGVGQKIPRFDNRIVEQCALIPRLNACGIAPIELRIIG